MKADNNERTDEGERRVERLISEWKIRGPEIERQWRADRAEARSSTGGENGEENGDAGAAIVRATTKEAKGEDERNASYPIGWLQELRILATRNLLQTSRDPAIWAASFGSNIVLLIIIGPSSSLARERTLLNAMSARIRLLPVGPRPRRRARSDRRVTLHPHQHRLLVRHPLISPPYVH